jgi:hypothetical protein
MNVLFRSQAGVFVVLDDLQVNQAKGKDAKKGGESAANQRAARSAFISSAGAGIGHG